MNINKTPITSTAQAYQVEREIKNRFCRADVPSSLNTEWFDSLKDHRIWSNILMGICSSLPVDGAGFYFNEIFANNIQSNTISAMEYKGFISKTGRTKEVLTYLYGNIYRKEEVSEYMLHVSANTLALMLDYLDWHYFYKYRVA